MILESTNDSSAVHGKVDKNGEGAVSPRHLRKRSLVWEPFPPVVQAPAFGQGERSWCGCNPALVRSRTELALRKPHVSFVSSRA